MRTESTVFSPTIGLEDLRALWLVRGPLPAEHPAIAVLAVDDPFRECTAKMDGPAVNFFRFAHKHLPVIERAIASGKADAPSLEFDRALIRLTSQYCNARASLYFHVLQDQLGDVDGRAVTEESTGIEVPTEEADDEDDEDDEDDDEEDCDDDCDDDE